MRRTKLIIRFNTILVLAAGMLASGCLFTPREAELPGEGGDPWVVPNAPKDVFINLGTGFSAIANSNYERSLSDNFTFLARPADWPGFVSWDKSDELSFLDRLKADYTGERTIQFGDENGQFAREEVEVGSALYEGRYIITLDRGDGSDPDIFAGIAIFYLEKGATGWGLVRWDDLDIFSDEYSTSSYLRNTFQ
ncbi:MAG TPA: hypothetical protein VLA34_15100 [Candidatus Krumholzibacterium sp.]|nr:hypothetical protein [Candidatus Krumholzibacterium sp.]